MEGCSKFCSFCIVPYTRGEEVSRPFDDVLTEVAGLAAQGVQEVTLLGQNVNAYRGAMLGSGQALAGDEAADLALLIEYIAEIPGIERIRYTTSHPARGVARLIDVYARVPKLVSHLHLPVQSGSDRVLAAMKRGYTALEYKSLVRKLRAARPDLSLSSDFIVGFPGETADDFEKTMKLIDEVGFDASFSFLYSARPGTPAAELPTIRRIAQARTSAAPAEAHRRTGAGGFGSDGRQRPARAGRRRVEERTGTNSPGAPTTTASSISPARLATARRCSIAFSMCASLRPCRTRCAARSSVNRMNMTSERPDCKHPVRKAGPPNCCCRRSTTSSSPTCAAPSTRICARSRPPSTSRSPAAASVLRCAAKPDSGRARPRRCSSSTPRPRTRCRSTRSSSA
jgi:hypothetical protein